MNPAEFQQLIEDTNSVLPSGMLEQGFCPISPESGGDAWVTESEGGPTSAIYLYSPSLREYILASHGLSLLMANMGVSELSFPDRSQLTSILWHPEK